MIELAAAAWQTSPAAAVRRLQDAGALLADGRADAGVVDRYVRGHVLYRRRLEAFWRDARDYLVRSGSPVLAALRSRFRLVSDVAPDVWAEGPGRLFGGYPHVGVERLFCPSSVLGNRCVSRGRVFRGRGWGDVLVVAHHDLPGRLCGFLFVGRRGEADDRVYRAVPPRARSGGPAEAGLACLWAVDRADGSFGGHVVACDDVLLALRLHVRHFRTARTLLPLVACYDGPGAQTRSAWSALAGRVPVLWGWRLTPALVCQAVAADGRLAVIGPSEPTPDRVDRFVRDVEPRALLRRVVAAARPWRDFLTGWAEQSDDDTVRDLACALESYGLDTADLGRLGPRFARAVAGVGRPRQVRVGQYLVSEQDGQTWFVPLRGRRAAAHGRPQLLMNALLRIDGSSCRPTPSGGVAEYSGRLVYQGEEFRFTAAVTTLRQYTAAVLERVLIRARPGATLYVAPGWRGRLVEAAKLLSTLA